MTRIRVVCIEGLIDLWLEYLATDVAVAIAVFSLASAALSSIGNDDILARDRTSPLLSSASIRRQIACSATNVFSVPKGAYRKAVQQVVDLLLI